jgi:filamentous hemagglutinin family protein
MPTMDAGHFSYGIRDNGLRLNANEPLVTASGNAATFGGSVTMNGAVTFGSAATLPGGQPQSGAVQSTVFHSGGAAPFGSLTTNYTQTKLVTTDTYFCEVFIPDNATITGISIVNGHTTSASGNINVGLANSSGVVVASSATTNAQSTADTYQQIPFSAPYNAIGPAKYFICVQGSQTTGYIATHTAGNFSANLKTTETYGTFVTTASYATTTFTTADGPVADTY